MLDDCGVLINVHSALFEAAPMSRHYDIPALPDNRWVERGPLVRACGETGIDCVVGE